MTIRHPRLAAWALVASVLMILGAVSAPVVQASTASSMNTTLLTMINSDRLAVGLRPLRLDTRLAMLAAERAGSMAGTGQLSHGQEIAAAERAVDVQPYFAGEAIGETTASWGTPAAQYIYNLWRGSPEHWGLITSSSFNYIGVGVSYRSDTGQTFASLVFAEAPDSSRPIASITGAGRSGSTLVFTWSGRDGLLQTHTAGLRDFVIDYRVDNGPWKTIRSGTTATSITLTNRPSGHVYTVAVQARDRHMNASTWAVRSVRVP
jgi:uncharacterized protein YkwD